MYILNIINTMITYYIYIDTTTKIIYFLYKIKKEIS